MAGVLNNATIIRRELLTRVAKMIASGKLVEDIDRIPAEARPKGGESYRCCVYKDRAMAKYKLIALLGFNAQDEDADFIPLSRYAERALKRTEVSSIPLTVVDEACSACVKANYVVTNMCRGCVGRPCMVNCPKGAIEFKDGQAHVISEKCVNCGLCKNNCPYHAIIYTPVPCEESCPVGAISKDDNGIEHIDDDKCIYCGRCIMSCPFGAIMEKSHIVEVLSSIKDENKKVIAMVAPAIAGQFKLPLDKILGAIKEIGFDEVIEVALGANKTTEIESAELIERLEGGATFMTTSCCPSYVATIKKHIPEIYENVSHTGTPMFYTAEIMREKYPDAVLVFVGPCLAKRHELVNDKNTDYMMSFEEIGSTLVALNIDINNTTPLPLDPTICGSSRGYAVTNGVFKAVAERLKDSSIEIKPLVINGIDKMTIKQLRTFAKNPPANMIEIMSCEGGCVNGCNTLANPRVAARQVEESTKL